MQHVTMIPLAMLSRSEDNVRKTNIDAGIAELAESISREGLLQNLIVVKAAPGHAYTHEVVAGGRRLAALKLLAKNGKIGSEFQVPCRVVESADAEAISLAENQLREQMHPIDQLHAFVARVSAGDEVAEVAARFGVTEAFVRQRLKLAAVSPKLLEVYRRGDMTLEQLQAFTVIDDHERQEEVWDEVGQDDYNNDADDIRRELLGGTVSANDYRLKFVGIKAYQKAGGALIKPDLFAEADEQREIVSDQALLDDLVAQKLEKKAAKLKKDERLAFVEVRIGRGFETWQEPDFCRATVYKVEPTAEQAAQIKALEDKIEELGKQQDAASEADDDAEYDRLEDQIGELREQVEDIEHALKQPHPDELEHLGAFLCLSGVGQAHVVRNIIRKEHRAKEKAAPKQDGSTTGADDQEQPEAPKQALSEKLIARLTAHKTAIMRDSIMPHVGTGELALVTVVFHMLLEDMSQYTYTHAGPLTMSRRHPNPGQHASDLENGYAWTRADKCEDEWLDPIRDMLSDVDGLTEDRVKALWKYLAPLSMSNLLRLLAICVANRVDVTVANKHAEPRSAVLEPVFLSNDMIAKHYWQPTRANFLDHVSKQVIIASVTEACGAEAAAELVPMKRDAAAARAEQLLAGTGWLPGPLRVVQRND